MILAAAMIGTNLFRNDNGHGRRLHSEERFTYGLGKGTHDLIGYTPIVITEEMVGRTIAVFTSIEAKRGRDRLSDEQAGFLAAVSLAGGYSFVATTAEDAAAGILSRQPIALERASADAVAHPPASGHT
jgi:hypothetical protein